METEDRTANQCQTDLDKSTIQTPPSATDSDAELLERITMRLDRSRADATCVVEEGTPTHNHLDVDRARKTLRDLAFITPETELARHRAGQAKAREERIRAEEQRREHEARVVWEGKQRSWEAFIEQRGRRYAECKLANYEVTCPSQEAVVKSLREYCEAIKERIATGVNVMLLGPAGTGKDHLTVALARAAISACGGEKDSYNGFSGRFRPGFDIQWSNGPALFGEVRATFDVKGAREDQIIDRLADTSVLYLSDLLPPGGKLTDFQAAIVYQVVDSRYNHIKPTWLTLNVATRCEMEAGLGSAIVDRLIDGALILQCNWPSYRKKAT